MESKSVRVYGRQLPWTFLGRPRSMYIAAFQRPNRGASTHDEVTRLDEHPPPGATLRTMKALTPDQIADWCHPTGNPDREFGASCLAGADPSRSSR
jgi:hypothetical protein